MAEVAEAPAPAADAAAATGYREVKHEYSLNFPPILTHLGSSLLVSTYQAGKVVAVSVYQGALNLSFHNFERAMGMAVRPGRIAVGAHSQIWFLRSALTWPRAPNRSASMTVVFWHDHHILPATSTSTRWPGPATSCGSPTRSFPACVP